MPRKKKIDEQVEARIAELEDKLLALKADYFGTALDELRLPRGDLAVVTFRLGPKNFALPLWAVKGISRAVALAEEGELGPGYVGAINYHDEMVPVLDVSRVLGAESRELELGDHVIYFSAGGRRVALVVTAVIDVETLDGGKVVPAGEAGLPRRPFLGAYDQGGTLLRLLEPAALLPDVGGAGASRRKK